ncbi:MAG: hypothetical protein ACXVLQ_12005 [Bacteriovorax sp.]
MGQKQIVFALTFLFYLALSSANAEILKTINVAMPTNYGTFLGEIHYSEKDLLIALKVERIIKEDLIKVINYFEYVPHDVVHFNLDPYLRLTNGNARTFPTNIINLYNFPANNREHLIVMDNWLQGLVLHEFVHITHLDQTRDYLQVGRQIFGTIAKVPTGIVPRWFTEGIAVWGESHLIAGGRLNSPLFNKELLVQFQKHDFCKTVDCLDTPGVYPQGQLAYWAGAHFIEYLENKKPKTIKCLVEQNSLAVPFFLNNAFEKCIGEKAQDAFVKFREDYLASEAPVSKEKREWGDKISNVFGSDDYQKGFVLDGDRLFKAETERYSEALIAYDLKDAVTMVGKFDSPISDIVSMVDVDNENRQLLVSFNDDPNFRAHNKVWKLINPDTLLVERTLDFHHDPSYVVSLGGESYITFSYWQNKWRAERGDDLLREFSGLDNITLAKKLGDRLLLRINDSYGTSSLVLADLKLEKLDVVYKSTNTFDLPLISEKFLVIREQGELKLLEWDKDVSLAQLPSDLLNRITFADYNEGRVLALENGLMTSEMRGNDFENELKKNKSNTAPVVVSEYKEEPAPMHSYASDLSENYPRYDHLLPHYWFLAFGNSENLSSTGAMTTFVDPMEVYSLNASALIYPSEKRVGGSLDYTQKLVKASDLWFVSAFFNQDYSKTDFSSHINLSRDFTASTFYTLLKKRWTYVPGFFVGSSSTQDFISDRMVTSVGVTNTLKYQAQSFDDFFQAFTGSFNFQSNKADIGDNYLATHLDAEISGRFTENFLGSIKGSYGKLYKSDFSRGVIYGGGVSDYSRKRTHEFYGLPYSNAYGNEIFTARLMGDYNFWNIYRGKNLLPFFFKEAHLLFGGQSLYANRIILDDNILRDKMINGIFVGPRLKMNLFYYVPTNIDVIFSSINNPNGKNVNQVDFLITADLFTF